MFTFQDREMEAQGEMGLHAYVKPREDEIWSAGRKALKPVKQKISNQDVQGSVSSSTQGKPH